ncbi:hypothetical protein [Agromyces badenianii]|uniref:hypothetical protein n=1 Tax=Agromyces badenianii TaxID=2080742 RepID=UPI0014047578|nr:hypothetical protein [Agromyces badenianii]
MSSIALELTAMNRTLQQSVAGINSRRPRLIERCGQHELEVNAAWAAISENMHNAA